MNEPETIRQILKESKTIAVVGLSAKHDRASFSVSHYMQSQGYRIIPVNPIHLRAGRRRLPYARGSLCRQRKSRPGGCFSRSTICPGIVEEVIRLKIPYLWLQEGVCDQQAAERAEAAGIKVVMDHCIFREHARFARA